MAYIYGLASNYQDFFFLTAIVFIAFQTQEVAKAFGAACTPDFFLFKKVNGLQNSGSRIEYEQVIIV